MPSFPEPKAPDLKRKEKNHILQAGSLSLTGESRYRKQNLGNLKHPAFYCLISLSNKTERTREPESERE